MPFIGGNYRQRQGMQESPERPKALPPVEEHYEGENFAYRGTETHGVQPTPGVDHDAYYGVGMWDDGNGEVRESLPEEKVIDPVPVIVVQQGGRERHDWRAGRFYVKPNPQEIVGRHEMRKSLRIRNHDDTNPVYISPDSGLSAYSGYMIPPGGSEQIYSTENVFVICDPGVEGVEVSILTEFGVAL